MNTWSGAEAPVIMTEGLTRAKQYKQICERARADFYQESTLWFVFSEV